MITGAKELIMEDLSKEIGSSKEYQEELKGSVLG
jgi:hypothetical protein